MTSFSCEELEKQAKDRYCLHTKKCFCLPPAGEDMSFDDIAEMFDKIDPERSFETRYPFPWTFLLEFEKRIGTTINLVDERHVQTKEDFLALCTRFNFPLCPHLCLNDEKITSRFPPPEWADCLMDNRRDLRCELCKTEAHLVHWGSVLQLHVYRPVGNLKSPRDPVWIAQTFSSRVACLEPARAAATTEMMVHCWGLLSETPLQFEPKNGPFFTPVTLPPQEPKKRVTSLMRRAWGHVRSAVL
ncbi:hypothetical protein FQN55_000346 [Onygenales sp. PD_40]|nr:hypothetical protein FQN55_000346 [Onygenales sp. PD_40]KAK2785364.1 hypothetical protein FQN53_007805 [Emmonsiellopsis sp. PD_33]KAK2794795.1 hypothetical protein FQN52_007565 [Onygenales sp. PD_12]KAK2806309.1 hypothetical protein FQN51_007350 [Onygenales sp. PD_10]